MGICGNDVYEKGISWKRAKEKAMADDTPDGYIVVSPDYFLICFIRSISQRRSKRLFIKLQTLY